MRPAQLLIGNVLYWTIRTRDPDTQVLKDADSTPTVAIRKNDASTADSVTVTKRTATTGIYDCSYDPAGEVEGDSYTVEESAIVTGTTTDAATYTNSWAVVVKAAERGTDGANTVVPPTVSQIQSGLATEAKQDTAKTTIDAILVDTDETIPALLANMSGATFDTATDSLEAIRDRGDAAWAGGGGASASVNVLPAVGIVADRSPGATISPVVGETISQSITLYQTDGTTPVDLSGKTLAIVFETMAGVDVAVVPNANITISGDYDNVVTFAYPSDVTASERTLRFAIKDEAAPLTEYLKGLCNVTSGPRVDA